MATGQTGRKPGFGVRFATYLSLVIGVYAVFAVATILGFFTGAFAGVLGGLIALAAVTDRPAGSTGRVAKLALALNVLALTIVAAVLIGFWIAER
jgi:hypothetical protein